MEYETGDRERKIEKKKENTGIFVGEGVNSQCRRKCEGGSEVKECKSAMIQVESKF